MTSRTILTALLPVAALAAFSCSKTEDTAPERRVFGDPPTIQTVDPDFFDAASAISCDFTEVVAKQLCKQLQDFGYTTVTWDMIQPLAGLGWTRGSGLGSGPPSPGPGIFLQGSYTEAIFRARVTDPNSRSDILLVSASYVEPPPSKTETSLVMFNDGSFNKFLNAQRLAGIGEDCDGGTGSACVCELAKYGVVSGDDNDKDDYFTRKMAFHKETASPYLLDCIMRERGEVLKIVSPGTTLTFKIEAVDREGNLATWPSKLTLTSAEDTFACNGDPCGCCILQNAGSVDPECANLDGMIIPGFFDGGICADLY